jgi:PleD family two-component response regulator
MTPFSGFALALAVGILGIALWRTHQLRMQVKRIKAAAQAFVRGETAVRIDPSYGVLSSVEVAFNEMTARVEHDIQVLKSGQAELERLVATDRLTGVGNRRAFEQLTLR